MVNIECQLHQGPFDGEVLAISHQKLPAGLALRTCAGRYVKYRRLRCRGRRLYVYAFDDYAARLD